jgi:hypothetical protein
MELLSKDLDGTPPWMQELTLQHLVRASVKWFSTLSQALEIARPLVPLGINLPEIPPHMEDFRPGPELLAMFREGGIDSYSHLSARPFIAFAARHSKSLGEVLEIAQPLSELGWNLPEISEGLKALKMPLEIGNLLSRSRAFNGWQASDSLVLRDAQLINALATLGVEIEKPPPQAARHLLSLLRGRKKEIDELELATVCHENHYGDPAIWIKALEALAGDGWKVQGALDFARYARSHHQASST